MDHSGFLEHKDGRTYRMGNISLMFKPKPADALGDYSVWTSSSPAGSGASLHRHGFDEWHVVIAGIYEGQVAEVVRTLRPGDSLFAPRDTPHRIRNIGPGDGMQLGICSPAGAFEAFIAEVSEAAVDTGSASTRGSADFRAIAAKHGIEFIDGP